MSIKRNIKILLTLCFLKVIHGWRSKLTANMMK
jgi:hypothetical protein